MSEGIEQGEGLGGAVQPAGDAPAARPRMPWPVRVVAALAWTYVVSVAGLAAYLVVRSCFDRHFAASVDSFPHVFYMVVLLVLVIVMLCGVLQGRFRLFSYPCILVAVLEFFVGVVESKAATCYYVEGMALMVGAVVLGVVPVVLLMLPSSRKWQEERLGHRTEGYSCGCLLVFFLLILCMTPLTSYTTSEERVHDSCFMAKIVGALVCDNDAARKRGGAEWIDPATCSNSTQFVQALLGGRVGAYKYRQRETWIIAVNPPDADNFPVVVSANVDIAELLRPGDAQRRVALKCSEDLGAPCLLHCMGTAVVARKGGEVEGVRGKTVTPASIFGSHVPRPPSETYFLTPTGRLDLVTAMGRNEGSVPVKE